MNHFELILPSPGSTIKVYGWDCDKEEPITKDVKVLLANGDGLIAESKDGIEIFRCGCRDVLMNQILRDRTYEALDIWYQIFEQCLDRGDWCGIQEVDDHFGLIGGIKEAI